MNGTFEFIRFNPPNLFEFYHSEILETCQISLPIVVLTYGPFNLEDVRVNFTDNMYELPEGINEFYEQVFKFNQLKLYEERGLSPVLVNKQLLRLNSIHFEQGLILELSLTSYFRSFVTNTFLDNYIKKYGKTLREMYRGKEYMFSNHFGIEGMIITSDNYLILQNRSRNVMTNINQKMHSVSGSAKFYSKQLINPFDIFLQQSKEELLLDVTKFCALTLIGVAKYLLWQRINFFFYAEINETYQEFSDRISKNNSIVAWEHSSIEGYKIVSKRELKDYLCNITSNTPSLAMYYFYDHYVSAN